MTPDELATRILRANPSLAAAWITEQPAQPPPRKGSVYTAAVARMWDDGSTIMATARTLNIQVSTVNRLRKRIRTARLVQANNDAATVAGTSN
jgi:hypothetical protein